ncbi:hypothetical protein GJV26_22235 [Massilia dura]|uniref:Phasin domain-containing protein n=1 Tax=Pseudoduganella dura TaxID=321982 RepID=A0A6I3XL41_9BURK|nr:hypothetical protein [Pseudoduganella dura]MUI15163.1 hypothetical protein [Pseudoduganella dura]GGY16627.1 hypothetical protein GCM10007386_53070 [Pseudoduganella dura]
MTTFPATMFPASAPVGKGADFLNIMAQLGNAYSNSFQSSTQEIWLSSFRIVQEHTARALVNASQECAAALARNAAEVGQRSFSDIVGANQQALTMFGSAFTNAVMAGAAPQNYLRLLAPA